MLASGVHECIFCESSALVPLPEEAPATKGTIQPKSTAREQWRGELNQRLQAYRARRRKAPGNTQSALPFDEPGPISPAAVQVEDFGGEETSAADDFAFTIAIGRIAKKEDADPQVLIDVSNPPQPATTEPNAAQELAPLAPDPLFPVAPLEDRRRALLADAACLAFAYGGFLALFGSLGGHFTLSKLSAAVCVFTFAFVYLQYFGLFTIFGGSTPGMMLSGLQVASVTGDVPTPRQYLLRAVGYMLSAGTCFLGFLWVLWDEDGLTWHDRLSRTYLTKIENLGEEDLSQPAAAR